MVLLALMLILAVADLALAEPEPADAPIAMAGIDPKHQGRGQDLVPKDRLTVFTAARARVSRRPGASTSGF